MELCSEDGHNLAVYTCFCQFPLPGVCQHHLSKHPTNTDFLCHFLLPVEARALISTREIHDQYKLWLFKLHSAYSLLRRNSDELRQFEEVVEALRLELLYCFDQEVNKTCADAKKRLIETRRIFEDQLNRAIAETSSHALQDWTPAEGSLEELIWTYDITGQSLLKMFRLFVEKADKIDLLKISIDSSLPDHHNRLQGYDTQTTWRSEVKANRVQISRLQEDIAAKTKENNELKRKIEALTQAQQFLEQKYTADISYYNGEVKRLEEEKQEIVMKYEAEAAELFQTQQEEIVRLRAEWAAEASQFSNRLPVSNLITSAKSLPGFSQVLEEPEPIQQPPAWVSSKPQLAQLTTEHVRLFDFQKCKWGVAFRLQVPILCDDSSTYTLLEGTIFCCGSTILQQLPNMIQPRSYTGVVPFEGVVYVFGGMGNSTPAELKTGECLSSPPAWSALPGEMRNARRCFNPYPYGRRIYLCGGRTKTIEFFDMDIRRYQLCPLQLPDDAPCVTWIADGYFNVLSTAFISQITLKLTKLKKVEEHAKKKFFVNSGPVMCGGAVWWVNKLTGLGGCLRALTPLFEEFE